MKRAAVNGSSVTLYNTKRPHSALGYRTPAPQPVALESNLSVMPGFLPPNSAGRGIDLIRVACSSAATSEPTAPEGTLAGNLLNSFF